MALPATIDAATAALPVAGELPLALLAQADQQYPKPPNVTFAYGTAGVRTKGDLLPSVSFRLALVSVLRSKKLAGQWVGLMVTASHNPEEDNGLKAVDPMGEMLDSAWEPFCTAIANAPTTADVVKVLQSIVTNFKIDLSNPSRVIFGHDTRPTSPALMQAIAAGLSVMGCEHRDVGLKTTPQLHYIVRCENTKGAYGEPTEEGYFKKLSQAFLKLVAGKPAASPLTVDCANGVGSVALEKLQKYIPADALPLKLVRTDIKTKGALNSGCGADYVKTGQRLPLGLEKEVANGDRVCSLDGDADRIVFYYTRGRDGFRLLDGDKIASLASDFISELVKKAGLEESVQVGCVQTAYANGSSTKYLSERVPVKCTPTGVKYLHHAAQSFDIGVYFEANGHGTVLFSKSAEDAIRTTSAPTPAAEDALSQLGCLIDVINQTVGDALSDMLLVEIILRCRGWGFAEWDGGYEDLPNKLLKVVVPDRTRFKTEDAERRLVEPAGLQDKIDAEVSKYKGGRSFVRPSGTEDVVRVYAECAIAGELNGLANAVAKLVADNASA